MSTKKKSTKKTRFGLPKDEKKKTVKKPKAEEEKTPQPTATSPSSFTWSDESEPEKTKPAKQKLSGLAMYGIQIADSTDKIFKAAKSAGVSIHILPTDAAFVVSRTVEGRTIMTRDQLTAEDNTKLRAFAEASGVKFKPQWVFVVP